MNKIVTTFYKLDQLTYTCINHVLGVANCLYISHKVWESVRSKQNYGSNNLKGAVYSEKQCSLSTISLYTETYFIQK